MPDSWVVVRTAMSVVDRPPICAVLSSANWVGAIALIWVVVSAEISVTVRASIWVSDRAATWVVVRAAS